MNSVFRGMKVELREKGMRYRVKKWVEKVEEVREMWQEKRKILE